MAGDGIKSPSAKALCLNKTPRILRNAEDFASWSHGIIETLRKEGLEQILYYCDPAEASNNSAVRTLILQHVKSSIAEHLDHHQSASEVWKNLQQNILGCAVCDEDFFKGKGSALPFASVQKAAAEGCRFCGLIVNCVDLRIMQLENQDKMTSQISTPFKQLEILRRKSKQSTENTHKRKTPKQKPYRTLYGTESVALNVEATCVTGTLFREKLDILSFRLQPDDSTISTETQDARSYDLVAHILSEQKLAFASTCLDSCIASHRFCAPLIPKFMPTRLIEVGDCDHPPRVQCEFTSAEPYAALSYQWGPTTGTLMLSLTNIQTFAKGIPLADIPKTLLDAVVVCRKLGIRYLWVDALCIIQDDTDRRDWYIEASRMCSVYSNAHFVLAVHDAVSCDNGFLTKYEAFDISQGDDTLLISGLPSRGPALPVDALSQSSLSSRGWTMQECLLPPRILHFFRDEIIWECEDEVRRQDGTTQFLRLKETTKLITSRTPPKVHGIKDDNDIHIHLDNFLANMSPAAIFWVWDRIVEDYSKRVLTQHNDKLIALSGIAQIVLDRLALSPDSYLAGIWSGNLLKGLLWHSTSRASRFQTFVAPSWSWASMMGPVRYFFSDYQFTFEEACVVEQSHCTPSSMDPIGEVSSGFVSLTGRLQPVVLNRTDAPSRNFHPTYSGMFDNFKSCYPEYDVNVQLPGSETVFSVLIDELSELESGIQSQYFCFEIGDSFNLHQRARRTWWLVLKTAVADVEHHPRTFKRVGIGYRGGGCGDLFYGAEKTTIVLI
ncbi:heterokaryon incompatibility protein-domain-containing protein [Xylariales sp. PMI_506]|nr:heterokaryon incompatibility protein-domain-containing protein [Xylariales sp. PMI_506]